MISQPTQQEAPVGILTVTVIQAADIPKMDKFGENDAYVKLSVDMPIEAAESETSTNFARTQVTDLKVPIWHETFPFPCFNKPPCKVHVQVWDKDRLSSDDLIGTGILDVVELFGKSAGAGKGTNTAQELTDRAVGSVWIDIINDNGNPSGKLELLVHYLPKTSMERLSGKFSLKTEKIKASLTNKAVSYVANMASTSITSSFGVKS